MKNRDLTQEELAEKTGLPYNTIHRYVNDYKDRIPPERLELIATALGTTVSEIYSIKENPTLLNDPVAFYKGNGHGCHLQKIARRESRKEKVKKRERGRSLQPNPNESRILRGLFLFITACHPCKAR